MQVRYIPIEMFQNEAYTILVDLSIIDDAGNVIHDETLHFSYNLLHLHVRIDVACEGIIQSIAKSRRRMPL